MVREMEQQASTEQPQGARAGRRDRGNATAALIARVERALWASAARRRVQAEGGLVRGSDPFVTTDTDTPTAASSSDKAPPTFSGRWDAGQLVSRLYSNPQFYDIRAPSLTGGYIFSCAVRDQISGCSALSSFAVASAAEIAVSMAQRKNCTSLLSPQFLFSCASSSRWGIVRT